MITQKQRKNIYLILIVLLTVWLTQEWREFKHIVEPKKPGYAMKMQHKSALHEKKTASYKGQKETLDLIKFETDEYKGAINKEGGELVQLELKKYKQQQNKPALVSILGIHKDKVYIAKSGISGDQHLVYHAEKNAKGKKYAQGEPLKIILHAQSKAGVFFTKTYQVDEKYKIELTTTAENKSPRSWSAYPYYTLNEGKSEILPDLFYQKLNYEKPSEATESKLLGGTFQAFRSYTGAAYYTKKKPYVKLPFAKMEEEWEDFDSVVHGGWIAFQQPYFIRAWVPKKQSSFHIKVRQINEGMYTLSMLGKEKSVPAGGSIEAKGILYAGPEIATNLAFAKGLELTVDYGMLWIISNMIFTLLNLIHSVVNNWGVAIVLVTIFIRGAFYRFSEMSVKSQNRMREVKPYLDELRVRYANDPAQLRIAMAEAYKKDKVDPLGGCLPTLLTLPIFIALYFVLIESVELRHAPFVLWIHDLSSKDPYYVMPALYGVSQWVQQRVTPAVVDKKQEAFMSVLPFLFIFLFMSFPAGLLLYMFVNNCFVAAQNYHVNRKMKAYAKDYKILDFSPIKQLFS
jgi:YidC/Oxa1 family membrane protein insertase